ncbi:unnamed protein product [Heligmosomoides polygyrus]|uniref:Uncharacterized protein n=1 Tax=Heligmosomoides polygyrus TaxID=6339 RepID=A0A183FLR3_HELPZ|nr:unnamed protein product [Heligmosomoides polygyrus]
MQKKTCRLRRLTKTTVPQRNPISGGTERSRLRRVKWLNRDLGRDIPGMEIARALVVYNCESASLRAYRTTVSHANISAMPSCASEMPIE